MLTSCRTQRLAQRGGVSSLVPRLPQPLSRDLTWNRLVPKDEVARRQPLEELGSDAATRIAHHAHARSDNAMTKIDEKEPEDIVRHRSEARAAD